MGGHDIVVIGASFGGIKAVQALLQGLPPRFPAAVFVVVHTDPRSPNMIAEIVGRGSALRVTTAVDGEPISFGQVRVARADHHLLVERERVVVTQGPKENRSRPAVDTLFRSAATAFGTRVIGIVLTGRLDDGTAGLWAIKRAGGIAVVQDPSEAECPDMPKSARDSLTIDHCVSLASMAQLLTGLVAIPATEKPMTVEEDHEVPGVVYVCPSCNGPLREIKTGNEKLVRFRCLVGHTFSMMTLLDGHAEAREAALWSAVVALEHEAMFAERAAQQAWTREDASAAAALNEEAVRARDQGQVIRGLLKASPTRRPDDPTGT